MSIKRSTLIGIAMALFLMQIWWLLSDREPASSEMTRAYRKHVFALNENVDSKEMAALRQRLHSTALKKQRCEKLDVRRYRCESSIEINDQKINARHEDETAIYSHDSRGWSFTAIGDQIDGMSAR